MRRHPIRLFLVVAGLVLGIVGVTLVATAPRRNIANEGGGTATERAVVPVLAVDVVARNARERIEVTGIVQPIRHASLAAEVDGRVMRVVVHEHDRVSAGEVILEIDDSIRRAAVERAEAALLRAESTRRLAELEAERLRRLRTTGVSSQAELDAAENREREAAGAVGEARALLDEAKVLLERTRVRAPFDGILTASDVEEGDRLSPGSPIGELIDLSRVELELGVNEAQVVALRAGHPVELRAAVFPGRSFAGRVHRVGAAIDPTSRLFPVEIVVENPGEALLSGMVATAVVEIGDDETTLWIPREATLDEFGLDYVYVIDERDGATFARRRRVTLREVAFRPTVVAVVDGLEAGERIVGGDLRNVRDGILVEVEDLP